MAPTAASGSGSGLAALCAGLFLRVPDLALALQGLALGVEKAFMGTSTAFANDTALTGQGWA
eukprot:633005-Alexandrium_andersonii.AAC.1